MVDLVDLIISKNNYFLKRLNHIVYDYFIFLEILAGRILIHKSIAIKSILKPKYLIFKKLQIFVKQLFKKKLIDYISIDIDLYL